MAQIFPIDFDEKLTIANNDFILFSDSEDGNKIKKAQYSNLKGEKGDTGTAATITVGSTTTGEPGTSASVTNSGTTSVAVLDFTIPEGEKGDTGETGASIVSAEFDGDDLVFTKDDGDTVTLTDAKVDLKGDTGDAATITVGTTTTGEPGTNASVTNSGTSGAAVFNFTIPKGAKGATGATGSAATISVGTTTTGDAGTSASVTNSGTSSAAVFNFTIPKGAKGDTGSTGAAATISVGSTTTGEPGTDASVTNSGTSSAAVFDFTIPQGEKGDTGTAATIAVGSVTTGEAGSSATVTNSGTSSAAVFDFSIPKGDTGETGSAATVSVGSTTTLSPGSDATVTNSGTSAAAVFNFGIPQGETGATGNGIASVTSSKSGKITTVTITDTNGDSESFTVSDGADGEGAGDVVGPSSSTDGDIVLFDGSTGKLIKDGSKKLSDLVQTSGNQTIAGTKTFSTSPVVPNKTADATNTGTAIATEAQVYTVADAVSTINGKISSDASSSNKLVDKNYVDNSINSVTAYYITKNAAGDQFATYAELSAATTFYSGGVVRIPTRNDYTIVLADENYDNATTRYIYNSGWEYQYTINETAMSQAQLDALNSGITSGKVSTYDGYATTISGKQDALSLAASPTNGHIVTWGANNKTFADGGAIPTVPTNVSDFTNDAGYITSSSLPGTASSSTAGIVKLGSDTVQSVSAEAVSGTANRTYALQVNSSGQGVVNVPWTDTTYTSKTAASGGTDVSLVTTGEKYTWNNKQNALTTQTAYTSKGTATKVPTISTNTLGQVTAITETNITFPVTSVNGSTGAVTVSEFNPGGTATTGYVLKKTADGYGWDAESGAVTSVNGQTGAVTVTEFTPSTAGSTGNVLTKTAGGYDWAAPAASGIVCDPNSPINITKIRCGTESQYSNLGTYDSTCAYLTV